MDSELAAQDRDDPDSPMTGNLADTTPAGVLQVLSSRGATGAVRFLGDSGCTVYLDDGELYFAENDDTAEDIAVALVRPDRLSAEEWDRATGAGYPTETVGEELIATGSVSRELLASVVLSVVYDPLIALFRSPEGDYEFAPGVLHWIGPYRTFDVDAVVTEVRRRTREADEMTPVVPSLDAIVRTARLLPGQRGSVNLRRDDWEVVVAAAGGRTVSELAVDLGRGRWSTARIVYRLANADLLTVTVGDEATAADPFATVDFEDESAFGLTTDEPALVDEPDPDVADETDPWATSTIQDPWAPADTDADPWAMDAATDEATTDWANGLSAVPDLDSDDVEDSESATGIHVEAEEFEIPDLHPDVAKALAESTYADSATAINAMAARLGALDADEDDESATDDDIGDDAWGDDTDAAGLYSFNWETAPWGEGVETTPLPQRSGARADAQREAGSDPAWLDNLYNEFMPGEQADAPRAPAQADEAKPKGLRRLLSAIRRL